MDIGGIGEFALIAGIRRRMAQHYPPEVTLGIGDDCAILRPQAGMEWVITTDTQVEGVHFRRDWLTPYQIGWRALAVNLSDIAAMGAEPFGALAALSLPVDTAHTFFEDFLDGLWALAEQYSCPLIGGNLTRDPAHLSLTFTLLGRVPLGQSLRRSGAKAGDEIWVSGRLGGSAAGLRTWLQPNAGLAAFENALRLRYAQPQPRIREALFLRASGQLTSLIDLSDGLAGDLGHICDESGVGARISAADLPLDEGVHEVAAAMEEEPLAFALRGGEDFELCCTATPGSLTSLRQEFQGRFGLDLTPIGTITAERGLWLTYADGSQESLTPQAFDHFRHSSR